MHIIMYTSTCPRMHSMSTARLQRQWIVRTCGLIGLVSIQPSKHLQHLKGDRQRRTVATQTAAVKGKKKQRRQWKKRKMQTHTKIAARHAYAKWPNAPCREGMARWRSGCPTCTACTVRGCESRALERRLARDWRRHACRRRCASVVI